MAKALLSELQEGPTDCSRELTLESGKEITYELGQEEHNIEYLGSQDSTSATIRSDGKTVEISENDRKEKNLSTMLLTTYFSDGRQ